MMLDNMTSDFKAPIVTNLRTALLASPVTHLTHPLFQPPGVIHKCQDSTVGVCFGLEF